MQTPETTEELAYLIRRCALHDRTIELRGNASKLQMGGPVHPADETVSLRGFYRVLEYEPRDLTISVEAGLPWHELTWLLSENRQMIPLDPPFADTATVGGVIASNSNGPRRLLYGTARDLVIGMEFATLAGKLVRTGGMVVKNVAGLDMAKLMIGSFGTLAAITIVNFKVQPMPGVERSFLLPFAMLEDAIRARDQVLKSVLQPSAVDLLNPAAGATLGNPAWLLAIRAGGSAAVMDRYERDLAPLAAGSSFEKSRQEKLWSHIAEFTPRFLASHPDSAVVRVSCTLKEFPAVMDSFDGPAIGRAGSGVCYGYFDRAEAAGNWLGERARQWKAVIEFAPEEWKPSLDLWPCPGGDLEIMRRVKNLYDPGNVLNRGRLYNRI